MDGLSETAGNVVEAADAWWASGKNAGSGYQVVFLSRMEGGKEALLGKYDISPETAPSFEDFQLAVKEEHGGGIYLAVLRTPLGQFVDRMQFGLSGLPKRQAEPAPVAQAAPAESGMDKVMAMMLENQRRSDERLTMILERIGEQMQQKAIPEPKVDPFEMLERAANLLGKTGATPPPPKTLLEQVKELKEGAELLGLTGVGKGGEGSDPWGALTALAGPLMEVVKEGTVNDRLKLQLAMDRQKAAAGQPAPAAAQVQPATAGQFQALLAGFAPVLPQLVQAAAGGHPAAQVAGHLLGIVPAADVPTLRTFLERDSALSELENIAPEIANHFEWFELLANTLIELIDGVADAAGTQQSTAQPAAVKKGADTGRPAGNPDHVATNGRPGPRRTAKPRNPGASAGADIRTAAEGLSQ